MPDFDIAIVGLGAMGSAVAYQCARRGMSVVGFDRFDPPHAKGSSHGDTRITRLAVGEGEDYVPFVMASHRIWRELEASTGRSLLTQCGALIIAANGGRNSHHGKTDFVGRTCRVAERYGIAHERFDCDALSRRFPYLTGLRGDEVAYFEHEGGFVRPEACIDAQLSEARRLGAVTRVHTEVVSVGSGREDIGIVTLAGGETITASKVVVAAGGWTSLLLGTAMPGLLSVSRQVLHWFETEGEDAPPETAPVMIWMYGEGDSDYFYTFPPLPGETSIKVSSEQYETTTTAETVRREVSQAESEAMFTRHLRGRLAGVSERVTKTAACIYTTTPDHGFILDHCPGEPGIFVISPDSGAEPGMEVR